jgi:hypothetical protein
MFSYKYYLDTTLYDGAEFPINGIEDFEEQLERDYEKRAILLKYPSRISFVGDAYNYIKTQRDTNTFCGEIDFKLLLGNEDGAFSEYQVGVIYVSTAIFDLNSCTVDCEVVDNSYFARILNNYKCEAMLAGNKSKNNVTITPCPYIEFKPFDPSTGGNLADSRYGVDVYDALKYLVQFMTDGLITFQSDWFENTTAGVSWKDGIGNNGLLIVNGEALRDTTGSSVKAEIWITFEKLFKNIAKLVNLWFYIKRNSDGTYTMKAERYNEFQDEQVVANLRFTQDLNLSFDNSQLFAAVEVGTRQSNYNLTGTDYIGYVPTLTFRNETYNIAGQCNNGSVLDLKTDFCTDHNLIVYQTTVATDDNNYDEPQYLIQYDNGMSNPHDCNKYNTFNNPPAGYYNRYLMNDWVLEMTDFHGELVKNNNPGDILFSAYGTGLNYVCPPTSTTMEFNNENYDPGGDYDPTTFRWTCPADGYYVFSLRSIIDVVKLRSRSALTNPFGEFNTAVTITYTPNIAAPFGAYFQNMFEGFQQDYTITFGAFYTAGDIEFIDITMVFDNLPQPCGGGLTDIDMDFSGSTWAMISSINGGILKPDDRNNILINKFALKSNIEQFEWTQLRLNSDKAYNLFITPQTAVKTWANSIKRKVLTGNTEIELLTNNLNY